MCSDLFLSERFPVDRAVMLSMLMHSSSKEVFQAAASTLAILSQQNGKGLQLSFLLIQQKVITNY